MRAKVIEKKLVFRKFIRKHEIDLNNLKWVYLQKEDVCTKGCIEINTEINRVIVYTSDNEKFVFMYEGPSDANKLIEDIIRDNPNVRYGYTDENKELFKDII